MLSKKERLNRTQFSTFFAKGRRFHGLYTTLIVSPHNQFLASVVVSKKVFKLAHDRNRIRRRIYSLLRSFKTDLNLQGALIVMVKPAVSKLSVGEFKIALTEEIGRALNKR
jgi:ribonuclease P protein component